MAADYDGGPAHDIVVQAARELLLSEASDWQFLISTWAARDYAEVRFEDHVERFEKLSAIADRVHFGETMSSDELSFYEDCRQKDAPFPTTIDLKYWAALDFPLPTAATIE